MMIERPTWRHVFRDGIAPQLSLVALQALADALCQDRAEVCQGCNTRPREDSDAVSRDLAPVAAACPIGYACWQGEGLKTVGEVEDAFARVVRESDAIVGRYRTPTFLAWVDATDRADMRRDLLVEVNAEIARRKESA